MKLLTGTDEGAFQIFAVIGDPTFLAGGFPLGIHAVHMAAQVQPVRGVSLQVGMAGEGDSVDGGAGAGDTMKKSYVIGGAIRHEGGFLLGGELRGRPAQDATAAHEVQPREAAAQVGVDEMLEVRPEQCHFTGETAPVQLPQFGFQGVELAARYLGFKERHFIG